MAGSASFFLHLLLNARGTVGFFADSARTTSTASKINLGQALHASNFEMTPEESYRIFKKTR